MKKGTNHIYCTVFVSQGFWFGMLLAVHQGVFLIKSRAIIGVTMCFHYNSTIDPAFTYPMDMKQLVDCEIKRELKFTNESTSQLSATE